MQALHSASPGTSCHLQRRCVVQVSAKMSVVRLRHAPSRQACRSRKQLRVRAGPVEIDDDVSHSLMCHIDPTGIASMMFSVYTMGQ
eukprot:jgi/Chrzof1/2688/Cz11g25080.t1